MSRYKGVLSGIAYLSEEVFLAKARELAKQGLIPRVWVIAHRGEFDPLTGKRDKDHLHFLVPFASGVTTDTDRLTELWGSQVFPDGSRGSVAKCDWRPCKSPADWFWYSVHDEGYLRAKREEKEFRYKWEDFHGTDDAAALAAVREYWRSHPPAVGNRAVQHDLLRRASEGRWGIRRFSREFYEAGIPANMYHATRLLYMDLLAGDMPPLNSRGADAPLERDSASPGEGGDII